MDAVLYVVAVHRPLRHRGLVPLRLLLLVLVVQDLDDVALVELGLAGSDLSATGPVRRGAVLRRLVVARPPVVEGVVPLDEPGHPRGGEVGRGVVVVPVRLGLGRSRVDPVGHGVEPVHAVP